jgi:ornithine cyclodeaminase/alanine dehydrogenase-like protein (mu-crystallin family)
LSQELCDKTFFEDDSLLFDESSESEEESPEVEDEVDEPRKARTKERHGLSEIISNKGRIQRCRLLSTYIYIISVIHLASNSCD